MDEDLSLLLFLSKKTELRNSVLVSTAQLAQELNISQQTVSRKLRDLEEKGWIHRHVALNGTTIEIADNGRKLLDDTYQHLCHLLGSSTSIIPQLRGQVVGGIGEGKFYMQQQGYLQQFIEKLHFKPYPGTLNIRVPINEVKQFLARKNKIFITEFSTSERTYGAIYSYPTRINESITGAVIIPVRTHHPEDIVEIIASVFLRETLHLKNGSEVIIE